MFRFLRRSPGADTIARLHAGLMRGARQPAFYSEFGVPDTLDGRFEMAALHGALLVRRLGRAEAPGPDVARDLTDAIFEGFDIALRETGVGDLTVPKRMKKLAQNYLGRLKAYDVGLDQSADGPISEAIARNVFGVAGAHAGSPALPLARYMRAAEQRLGATSLDALLSGGAEWPEAGAFAPGHGET